METPALPIRPHDEEDELDRDAEEEMEAEMNSLLPRSRNASIFDFSAIPFSSSSTDQIKNSRSRNELGVIQGMSIILGLMIGSGIFASPGLVLKSTGSTLASLSIWATAGALNFCGAFSFAELGSTFPVNGGQKTYLKAAYGNIPSSSFSLSAIFILKPSSLAIISTIAAEYLAKVFSNSSSSPPMLLIKFVAILCMTLVSLGQIWTAKSVTKAQVYLTSFKILSLVGLLLSAIIKFGLAGGKSACDFTFQNSTTTPSSYAIALFAASWCFDGYETLGYIASEVKAGKLPKIITLSMTTAVILFFLVNISYFLVVPYNLAIGHPIGLEFGRVLIGRTGSVIIAVVVSISCIGALNSSLFTGSRLIVASAEDRMIPDFLKSYNEKSETPINAILLTLGITSIFILLGDFTGLTVFYGVVAWTFNLAVVLGLLLLRVQEPSLNRPFRVNLITPIIFASFGLFLLTLSTFSKPFETLGGFFLILLSAVPATIQEYQTAKVAKTHAPILTEDHDEPVA